MRGHRNPDVGEPLNRRARSDDRTRLDDLLPHYHFHERHRRLVAAPADRVHEALWAATLDEMPLVPLLFDLRSLPSRLAGRGGVPRQGNRPLLPQMLGSGFALLAEEPGQELVMGLIAQMWKRGGRTIRIGDPAEFVAFGEPGFVKCAMNFRLRPRDGDTWIDTETRVLATDPASRRGFGRYWLFIRPGSGLIRRSLLRAVARRAET